MVAGRGGEERAPAGMSAAAGLPSAAGLIPAVKKKVAKGSVFTLKGETVRFCMSERLFNAFTLSQDLGSTFGRVRGQTFSKSARFDVRQLPGSQSRSAPHTYGPETASVVASAGKGIRGALINPRPTGQRRVRSDQWPHVGQYDYDHMTSCRCSAHRTGTGGRFSTLPRDKHTQVQKVEEGPGPQAYNHAEFIPAPPKWSQSASPRFPKPPKMPGPGAYDTTSYRPQRPHSAHISRTQTAHITNGSTNLRKEMYSPGPGSYRCHRLFDHPGSPPSVAKRKGHNGSNELPSPVA
eukprot:TRINITY_DN4318_c0_g1_i2.p1 TRINITY_DN4318_c0_g1~~TRINITY_DN4318_c0_g1_i2.p1  ORF type:complete len:293 (+),score=58.24 TRINITY_DN4318_c0_g1_i2:206-1084(+)